MFTFICHEYRRTTRIEMFCRDFYVNMKNKQKLHNFQRSLLAAILPSPVCKLRLLMHSAWCWMIYTSHSGARVRNSDTAPSISWFFWAFKFLLRMIIFTLKLSCSLERKVSLYNRTKHEKTFTTFRDCIIKSFELHFVKNSFVTDNTFSHFPRASLSSPI